MRDCNKGFTLVELMVTVAVLAITLSIAIPSFTSSINSAKADTETGDLYRALNYARLEAINRAANVRVTPSTANSWTSILNIQPVSSGTGSSASLLAAIRVVPAMSSSAAVNAGGIAYIEYNSLGALNSPAAAVTMVYTRGTVTRNLGVCLSGRLILGSACP